jgi:5-(carboxyamino)imidazole ribonucleotide synthase
MQNFFSSSTKKIGILGGGQLGKMLTDVARKYDLHTKVLDPAANAPASFSCKEFVMGDFNDYETVMQFGQDCEVITIEIEGVNTHAMSDLQSAGKKVFPQPALVAMIQNKVTQKHFYDQHNLPTAPWLAIAGKTMLMDLIAKGKLAFPFVWKAAKGGYDGRGVIIVRNHDDLSLIPDIEALTEVMAPVQTEIALVVARNESGETVFFPPVEMAFHAEANLVEYVFCPAELPETLIKKAGQIAASLADTLGIVGVLAVELFVNTDGSIWINECAPRVHNSAHLSIESWATSQFEQHLRAILDFPLGSAEMLRPAVMVNLTGEPGFSGPVIYQGAEDVMHLPEAYIHLYGKSETRPYRKMGHVTLTAQSLHEAKKKAKEVKKFLKVISLPKT